MTRLLCIAICALAFFGNAIANHLKPQIKVTRIQVWYANQKYFSEVNGIPIKHNETYNNIKLFWTNIRDFPADAGVIASVYVTNSKHENPKLLLEKNIPFCKESQYRHLLPKFIVLPQSQLHGKCIKAGNYDTNDSGNFRFEVLVPNIHEISDYHYVHYRVGNKQELILESTYFSEWGYLKKY